MQNYFQIPRISNSDLKIATDIFLEKEPKKAPVKAFHFGSLFHAFMLEPHVFETFEEQVDPKDLRLIQKLATALQNNEFWQAHANARFNEEVILWTEPRTLVDCKCKIDRRQGYKNKFILDLKTTSAKTESDFNLDIVHYKYLRQIAFYMDSVQADTAAIVGVSKISKLVFVREYKRTDENIVYARGEYTRLLQRIKENNLFEQIFNRRKS